eukprot:CAMPEP_0117597154 /NCGR_PEP_ID=MMETSP0784-20121206/74704_1 /TAXON_ID=39447 /ORGANISM="" /LENGTH=549 /DNA_ID=CAMNT_0005399503 /DNA_START=25 /DNA_END=1675 /DNA_ORIENTATION=+
MHLRTRGLAAQLVRVTGLAPSQQLCRRLPSGTYQMALRIEAPKQGDEKAVVVALKALTKGVIRWAEDAIRNDTMKVDEAYAGICRGMQQALGCITGIDRQVFMTSLDLCNQTVDKLAPRLSALDVNMGLNKVFPILLDRTAVDRSGLGQVGAAAREACEGGLRGGDENGNQLHCQDGAVEEATMLLHTLLSEFGLRLCAQRDVVRLLLGAIAVQLERSSSGTEGSNVSSADAARPQLVAVLGTCNQFSQETVQACLVEMDPQQRKVIVSALKEAPNPRLVALGASAAEQEMLESSPVVVGSAVRAASRGRESSPRPEGARNPVSQSSPHGGRMSTGRLGPPGLPRGPSNGDWPSASPETSPHISGDRQQYSQQSASPARHRSGDASPSRRRRPRDRGHASSSPAPGHPSDASTAASTACPSQQSSADTLGGGGGFGTLGASPSARRLMPLASASTGSLGSPEVGQPRWFPDASMRPPAPLEMSTALNASGDRNKWRYKPGEEGSLERQRREHLPGTAEAKFTKKKDEKSDSIAHLMGVLQQVDPGWQTQ